MSDLHARTEFKRYSRPFAKPLHAAWGTWTVREGWLVRTHFPESGQTGHGEICPLPLGPSLAGPPSEHERELAFALWSTRPPEAWHPHPHVQTASLLSLDGNTAETLKALQSTGFSTHKIKVGIRDRDGEWALLKPILSMLGGDDRLRLDPNRAWKSEDWDFWANRLADFRPLIEYVEEPFPSDTEPAVWMERACGSLPLALDESLHGGGLEHWQEREWPGFWILKPSLMGSPEIWLTRLRKVADKIILSSAFETAIGMTALLRIAGRLPQQTVHGLGTQSWFGDSWGLPQDGPCICPADPSKLEALWNSIGA